MPPDGTNAGRLFNAVLALLRKGVGNSNATFRPGQWEAIQHVLDRRGPLLVVQKTGWGKSNVYFILILEQLAASVQRSTPLDLFPQD